MNMNDSSSKLNNNESNLLCNYLVVGAGTAGMSFIDTLMTENPKASVILVDRNSKAGGHWLNAYSFVRLHQPSCNYGVNSLRLGKTISKGREAFDINDRASAKEIVDYYASVLDQFKATGRFSCFFDAEFKEENGLYKIVQKDGNIISVKCDKLVTVGSKVVVPSMRGPLFPIDESINYAPLNEIDEAVKSCKYNKYIVLGAGKTGSDAVIRLLREGVPQSKIQWIISRDIWYIMRDEFFDTENYWRGAAQMYQILINENSIEDVFLSLEKANKLGRLQKHGKFPKVCKGATIDSSELKSLQSIEDTIRLGRVQTITSNEIIFQKASIGFNRDDTLFVDCMVDKLYGYEDYTENYKFFEKDRINLGPFLALFNPSFTSALVGYIEATFNNDEIKNKFCFPVVGQYGRAIPDQLIGGLYSQSKSMLALSSHPPAMSFLLNSRTRLDAPMHHGGMLKFLWAVYGPSQLRKYSNQLIQKVESLSYSDLDHSFGNDRSHAIDSNEIKASLSQRENSSTKYLVDHSITKKMSFSSSRRIEATAIFLCFIVACFVKFISVDLYH